MSYQTKKTILLVEDEAVISIVHKKSLENYGYNIIIASSGEKAIELFKASETIDLILMDIDLGAGIDGTETADIILKLRDIPVVFLSSHTEHSIVEKTEKITSYGYVAKNSGVTVLDASIKMAFKLFKAKKEASINYTMFRSFFNSEIIGTAITSPEGSWIHVNDRLCEMLGFSRDELLKRTWKDLTPEDDLPAENELFKKVLEGKIPESIEKKYIRGNGDIIEVRIFTTIVRDEEGNIFTICSMIEDITERKQNYIKLTSLNEELTAINEEFEAANEELIETNIRLEEQEQKFRSLFENTGSGIIVIEEDTTISLAKFNLRVVY